MRASGNVQHGFTIVELLVTIVILGTTFAVLTDTLILGLRTTKDTETRQVQSNGEQFIAHFLTRDVQPSFAATPLGSACGVANAALVTTEQSTPVVAAPDQAVAYSVSSSQLVRATCAVGAVVAATTQVVAEGITSFVATCAAPGACGTVHLAVQTAAGVNTPSYAYTLDIVRRQP